MLDMLAGKAFSSRNKEENELLIKERALRKQIEEMAVGLDGKPLPQAKGKTFKWMVARAIILTAIKGNTEAQKELLNRTDGKTKEYIDLTTGDEKVTFVLKFGPQVIKEPGKFPSRRKAPPALPAPETEG